MLTNIASLESKVGEWGSQWLLKHDTPIEVCKEMLFQFGKYIAAVEDAVKLQVAKAEDDKEKLQSEQEKEQSKVQELKAE